jgi:SAD/SRA domain/HNH endonuclease
LIAQGDVISYTRMCGEEGESLQRGMNFRIRDGVSVILMSLRTNAPYADRIEQNGKILIYEGHDTPKKHGGPDPKMVDQPAHNPSGTLNQNGLFLKAAEDYKRGDSEAELVRVYEKIRSGIWVYSGLFRLVDAWQEHSGGRKVFKYKLDLIDESIARIDSGNIEDIDHTRVIPTQVKLEVWKRDKGNCIKCGSTNNLHFDHIIPYTKGGSSRDAANIQLLCDRHNLAKSDKIE